MISFFRRFFQSKVGLAAMIGLLVLIAFAFVAGDLSNVSLGGGGATAGSGGRVMTVDGDEVTAAELQERVRREFDAARQQQPELTFEQYVAGGGVESVAERMLSSFALDAFARSQGMTVSRANEVARIQQIPAFKGLDGRFDRVTFDAALRQIGLSEAGFREEVGREMLATQVMVPVSGAARAPATLVRATADLLLETRRGAALFIPVAGIATPIPTDAELRDAYRRNVARYTVPERRTARYALIDAAGLAAAPPSDADVQAAYRADARYAARETRTLSQVILPTEASARQLAQRVAGGSTLAAAASAAGLEPATLAEQSREAFARLASAAVAEAAFGAAEGAVAGPARSGLGWHVVRVDGVQSTGAQPIEAVRDEIVARLTAERATRGLADAVARVQDLVAEGSTFDEAAAALRLPVAVTPPLLPDGRQAGAPPQPAPLAVQLAQAAFGAEPDDDPVIQEIVAEQSYALVDVERVVPAAAPPFEEIRARVEADVRRDRALAEAQRLATGVAARAAGPATLVQAIAGAGRALPAATPISGQRQELGAGNAPPQLAALFSLRRGEARAFQAPDRSGWHVVHLDAVQSGDARTRPDLLQGAAVALGQQFGGEYAQQFMQATRAATGSGLDPAAVAGVRRAILNPNQ